MAYSRRSAGLRVAVSGIAMMGLMGGALDPGARSDGSAPPAGPAVPPIVVTVEPSSDAPALEPAAPAVPAKKAATPAKKEKAPAAPEVLPWANATNTAPDVTAAGPTLPPEAEQCRGLFEAGCRENKACAWVADMPLADGTIAGAYCAGRPAPPPKKQAKTKPKPKPKPVDAPAAAAPPATPAPSTAAATPPPTETLSPKPVDAEAEAAASAGPIVVKPAARPKSEEEPAPVRQAEDETPAKPSASEPAATSTGPSFGNAMIQPGLNDAVTITFPRSE